jgi:hypothetical protein
MEEAIVTVTEVEAGQKERVPSHLSSLRKRLAGGRRLQREEFENILHIARIMARQDPQALPLLLRLVGRVAQIRGMARVVREKGPEVNDYDDTALFDHGATLTRDGRRLDDLKREAPAPRPLNLAWDLIFPWPWNAGRIINAFSNLRPGGEWGPWRQDPNHCVELWLPVGIAWVHGGNHSITAGILRGEGEIRPEITYDISQIYKHVTCDGIKYYRKYDGKSIGVVPDFEMAVVFEIGRLMSKYRVQF